VVRVTQKFSARGRKIFGVQFMAMKKLRPAKFFVRVWADEKSMDL